MDAPMGMNPPQAAYGGPSSSNRGILLPNQNGHRNSGTIGQVYGTISSGIPNPYFPTVAGYPEGVPSSLNNKGPGGTSSIDFTPVKSRREDIINSRRREKLKNDLMMGFGPQVSECVWGLTIYFSMRDR